MPVPAPIPNGRVTRSSAAASAAATRAVGGLDVVENVATTDSSSDEEIIEPVHARGPDVIGMEDTGPQVPGSGGSLPGGRIDVEGALGRRGEGENMAAAATTTAAAAATVGRAAAEEEEKEEHIDRDGDIVVADADGVAEDDEDDDRRAELSWENKGPDAVDSTTL